MAWEALLKTRTYGKKGLNSKDIAMVDYIMKDGMGRTIDKIFDDIYDMINKTKKLGNNKTFKLYSATGRPQNTRFEGGKVAMKLHLTNSPKYESKVIGENEVRTPVMEFKYVGN